MRIFWLVVGLAACGDPDSRPATYDLGSEPAADLSHAPNVVVDAAQNPGAPDDLAHAVTPTVDLAEPPVDLAPINTGPCPVAADATAFVVYGEANASGWDHSGFHSSFDEVADVVCSGSLALRYTAHQYDGVQFSTDSNPVLAKHLSVRAHLDVASQWAVAAVKPGETDPHQFLGNPVVMNWSAGWNRIELDIPASTPQTRWILFEKQDVGNATLVLDDLRLR